MATDTVSSQITAARSPGATPRSFRKRVRAAAGAGLLLYAPAGSTAVSRVHAVPRTTGFPTKVLLLPCPLPGAPCRASNVAPGCSVLAHTPRVYCVLFKTLTNPPLQTLSPFASGVSCSSPRSQGSCCRFNVRSTVRQSNIEGMSKNKIRASMSGRAVQSNPPPSCASLTMYVGRPAL